MVRGPLRRGALGVPSSSEGFCPLVSERVWHHHAYDANRPSCFSRPLTPRIGDDECYGGWCPGEGMTHLSQWFSFRCDYLIDRIKTIICQPAQLLQQALHHVGAPMPYRHANRAAGQNSYSHQINKEILRCDEGFKFLLSIEDNECFVLSVVR